MDMIQFTVFVMGMESERLINKSFENPRDYNNERGFYGFSSLI